MNPNKPQIESILQASKPLPRVSALLPVILVLLWIVITEFKLISPVLLPSPMKVFSAIKDIGPIKLGIHFASTLFRVFIGFMIGLFCGFTIGVLMQWNRVAFIILDPIVQPSRAIPPVALLPFFILIFGFSELGRIILVALGTSLIICVGTIEAINRVKPSIVKLGRVLGLSRKRIYWLIIIPASLPELRGTLRISMALAITLVIVAEFLGVQNGLGYLINLSRATLSTHTILLSVILLSLLSWGLDQIIVILFRGLFQWDRRSEREN